MSVFLAEVKGPDRASSSASGGAAVVGCGWGGPSREGGLGGVRCGRQALRQGGGSAGRPDNLDAAVNRVFEMAYSCQHTHSQLSHYVGLRGPRTRARDRKGVSNRKRDAAMVNLDPGGAVR